MPATTERPYLSFVDWLKCLGILLIVYGHVVDVMPWLVPPIYSKQFGVALFVFAMGFSLARETRPRWEVVFKRSFDVGFFAVGAALIWSAISYELTGNLLESNYLPFLLGANVILDYFPANPTTWYVGTYLHVLLVWAVVFRSLRVRAWMLLLCLCLEIAIRLWLILSMGRFVAYMMFPNWATTFLLGMWYGQQRDRPDSRSRWGYGLALAVLLGSWSWSARLVPIERTFPFMQPVMSPRWLNIIATSSAVSVLYVSVTWLVFNIARHLDSRPSIRFIARNTVIIFIVHMPLYYAVDGPLRSWVPATVPRAVLLLAVCVVGLGLLSEALTAIMQPKQLRNRLWDRLAH